MNHEADVGSLPQTAAEGRRRTDRLAGRSILVVGGGGPPGADDEGDIGGGAMSDGSPDEVAQTGNGQAISMVAAREGASVVVADVDPAAAANTVGRIRAENGRADVVTADVRNPGDCDRLVGEAEQQLGPLDGIVLNVGIGAGLGLAGTEAGVWDDVFDVNVRSHFLVARRALPDMNGGSIVFIGSLAGQRPGTFSPSYDASKAAVVALCRHVATEGAPRGVRANVVAPGLIDTPMGRSVSAARPARDRVRIPWGRQGTPWEVAWTAVFLLSEEASYVTGQVIVVDGGLGALPAVRR